MPRARGAPAARARRRPRALLLAAAAAALLAAAPSPSQATAPPPAASSAPAPDDAGAPQCGAAFLTAASAALEALQAPPDCGSARLLILETDPAHFEGLGSVLIAVAEALAEAHAAQRTLVLGPPGAAPAVLRGANCTLPREEDGGGGERSGSGWECFFQPLSACGWAHVRRAERAALPTAPASCGARVKMSTPTRGAGMLYAVPDELAPLLPASSGRAAAAECWAAAVFARVARLTPGRAASLAARREALFPRRLGGGYSGAHLRAGDTTLVAEQFGGRVYTNKPVLSAAALGAALRPRRPARIYLATDADDADAAAQALGAAAGLGGAATSVARAVLVLPRFRTPHGSHNAAFSHASGVTQLLLPYETLTGTYLAPGGRYHGAGAAAQAAADQAAVREESLEDLYLLAHASSLAGSAASHFSVAARLWSLTRGGGAGGTPPAWVDAEGVASGLLANGFMHGQMNTTFALHHPEQRARVATRRWVDWPLSAGEEVIVFDKERCVPLVPRRTAVRLRAGWACAGGAAPGGAAGGADGFVTRCVARAVVGGGAAAWVRAAAGLDTDIGSGISDAAPLTSTPGDDPNASAFAAAAARAEGEACGSAADLVNAGVDFWEGFNVELASAAWRAAAGMPTTRGGLGEDSADVARENLAAMTAKRRATLAAYLPVL
jgi:hypothetical protein